MSSHLIEPPAQETIAAEQKVNEPNFLPMDQRLLSEFKRSLDYYQAQMGQSIPPTLILDSVFKGTDFFNHLSKESKMSIEVLSLNDLMPLKKPIDEKYHMLCLAAIGAGFDVESANAEFMEDAQKMAEKKNESAY